MLDDNILQNVRNTFGQKLVEIGERYPNVVVVTADLMYPTRANYFAEAFPDRFIDVGIAEQNCIGVAAGLATCDLLPVVCEYGHFAALRGGEQLRDDIAYTNLNVKIFAGCTGLCFGVGGATHQSFEDIAIIRSLPNMTLIVPADSNENAVAIEAAINYPGPVYVRFGRDEEHVVYDTQDIPFEIGKAKELRHGNDLTIIACGCMVYESLQSAELLAKHGITARVLEVHTVKPIDSEAIIKAAEETKAIYTIEEHSIIGGLGSAVLEVLDKHACPVTRIGLDDAFPITGPTFELRKHLGLHYEEITKRILSKMGN